jgi:hypothetical protein
MASRERGLLRVNPCIVEWPDVREALSDRFTVLRSGLALEVAYERGTLV